MSSRNALSVVLLLVLLSFVAACGGGEPDAPATVVAGPTVAATVPSTAATSTVPTAIPSTPTNTATPLPATVSSPSPTPQPPFLTPAPLCTPPACAPGQIIICPAGATCPGGCGSVCANPTATATSASPNPPPGGATRITFAPGATSAVVSSQLIAGGDGDTWLVRVNAGQIIRVQTIASPPGVINVGLLDPNGSFLASNADTVPISAAAATSGDYQINLATASGAPAVSYTLQVIVPPAGQQPAPTRIQFAPGQSQTQVVDSLAAGGDLNSYVLSVAAGQRIDVGVFASPPAATTITIRDTAGRIVSQGTDMSGATATATTAGDYFIDVGNFFAAPAVNYTLTVTVPPLAPPTAQPTAQATPTASPTTAPPPEPVPVRIEFDEFAISAQVDGTLSAGQPDVYVIRLQAGQTLITDLNDNPQGQVNLYVRDAGGATLNFGRAPTSLGTTVPATGDYTLYLNTANAGVVNYSLVVTAPPLPGSATRIEFAPGATSASVTGDIPFGGDSDTWAIRGGPGQTMTVNVAVNEATGRLRLYVYNAANQLIGLGTDITGLSAPLVSAGDYRIVLISDELAGPLSYTMTVEIR